MGNSRLPLPPAQALRPSYRLEAAAAIALLSGLLFSYRTGSPACRKFELTSASPLFPHLIDFYMPHHRLDSKRPSLHCPFSTFPYTNTQA